MFYAIYIAFTLSMNNLYVLTLQLKIILIMFLSKC